MAAAARRTPREWSSQRSRGRTWRQVDVHDKSLGYAGLNFKQNDKKAITTETFV